MTKSSTYHPQCLVCNRNDWTCEETRKSKREKLIEAGSEMSQMLKLADKDLKQIH